MNLSQMRTILRRRIQEKTADNWQDSDLNDLLNIGLHRVQLIITRVHPDAALHRGYFSIEKDNDIYDWPPGFQAEYMVEAKDDAGVYRQIKRLNFRESNDRAAGSELRYSRIGQFCKLSPMPTEDVAAGIRIWFLPTLTLSADTDIPTIPLVLHEGPIIWANKIAIGETGETSRELKEDWTEFVNLVADTYNITIGDPQYLSVDLDKGSF